MTINNPWGKVGAGLGAAALIAAAIIGIWSMTQLPEAATVYTPGPPVWHNVTVIQPIWHNTTTVVYVNQTVGSNGTPPGWSQAACPDVPAQAKAWGLRARCGDPFVAVRMPPGIATKSVQS